MYAGILFDLDGVIRHFGDAHLQAAAARYGVSRELILQSTFRCDAFQDALVGRVTAEEWHELARKALCAAAGRDIAAAVDDFIGYPGWVDAEMLALIDSLRCRLRVGILSNGTTRLEQHLELHDLPCHFDAIVNTARIGFAKPNAQAFLIAAQKLGVRPQQCILVDDRRENVEGALTAGLAGIHYTGLEALRAALSGLGVVSDSAGGI
jgi:putative hydrolase of the HAD superfamily